MGLEHFSGNEINQPIESAENNMDHTESERPEYSETPNMDGLKVNAEDLKNWKSTDSEREAEELPHIKENRDAENQYNSTYEERLKQTPKEDSERGEWSKERGESDYIAKDEEVNEILDQYGKDSITYKHAIPDFSEVSESTVQIEHMTENRADNFKQCDERCAEQWNREGRDGRTDFTAREVKEWRQENGYSWHERNDMKTCDLIPTKVNDFFGHLGGVSECKKRDAGNGGSDFDE